MNTRNEVTEIRERFADGSGDATQAPAPKSWRKAFGLFAVIFAVAVASGVLFVGCGSKSDSSTQAQATPPTASPGEAQQTQAASAVASAAPAQRGLSVDDMAVREGLPPDLSVSVGDTLVTPGEVVEFTVDGTTDVSAVALSDGRDEPTPFVRDQGADTWRAQYRVPLHPKHERFGVSVTAKTDADRWRRVWVFLHVCPSDSTSSDSTAVDNPDEMGEQH